MTFLFWQVPGLLWLVDMWIKSKSNHLEVEVTRWFGPWLFLKRNYSRSFSCPSYSFDGYFYYALTFHMNNKYFKSFTKMNSVFVIREDIFWRSYKSSVINFVGAKLFVCEIPSKLIDRSQIIYLTLKWYLGSIFFLFLGTFWQSENFLLKTGALESPC